MSRTIPKRTCPLCLRRVAREPVRGADKREYFLCRHCWLIAADKRHHLPWEHTQAYLLARPPNGDAGLLNPALHSLPSRIDSGLRAVDYYCGPRRALAEQLMQSGVACDEYDPIFCDVPLSPPYDIVFAAGCIARWSYPAPDLRHIANLLRPGGLLAITTHCWTDLDAFSRWDQTQNPTHVSFYHERSLDFIAGRYGFSRVHSVSPGVVLLQAGLTPARARSELIENE